MNFGEIFRSVIGFPRRENIPSRPRSHEGGDSGEKGFDHDVFFFGDVPQFYEEGHPDLRDGTPPGGGMLGRHMFDVFKHFDNMFKDFEKMTMGEAIEGGGFAFGQPHRPESGSLRDKMLKEPDSEGPPRPPPPNFGDAPPRPPPPNFYGRNSPFSAYSDQELRDTDLDEEVRKGNLEIVFGNKADVNTRDFLRPFDYKGSERDVQRADPGKSFKSVAVRTYRSADGRVEERRSIQDGRGNDETTVTRSIGDQEYSKTTKRDYTGEQSVYENFKNMSEEDKEDFNRLWKATRRSQTNPHGDIMHRDPGVIDAETRTIFRNLFGQSFPGFPSDLS